MSGTQRTSWKSCARNTKVNGITHRTIRNTNLQVLLSHNVQANVPQARLQRTSNPAVKLPESDQRGKLKTLGSLQITQIQTDKTSHCHRGHVFDLST
jgi:hypothetical protein